MVSKTWECENFLEVIDFSNTSLCYSCQWQDKLNICVGYFTAYSKLKIIWDQSGRPSVRALNSVQTFIKI